MVDEPLDCKSEPGLVVGMIEAIMTLAAMIWEKLPSDHPAVIEALRDLRTDPDLRSLLEVVDDVYEQYRTSRTESE